MLAHHFSHHLHLFQSLTPFFNRWGDIIILLSTFLEALPVIGYISPGGISVVLGGFLAREHALNFGHVFLLAYIGAIVGDLCAYGAGRLYGNRFLRNYGHYFFLKEKHIEKTEKLLQEHTGKAIIIGRFSYITRSLSPFIAGASIISAWKFFSWSLLSVLIWDVAHILIGFVAGQGYAVAARYVNYILILAIVLSVLIFYGYRFMNRQRHVFKKYHLYTLAVNILSIYIFAKALEDVLDRGWLFHIDHVVNRFIPTIWNPFVIQFMIAVSDLLTPLNVFLFASLFIGYLLHRRQWYYGLVSFFALIFGVFSEYIFKIIIGFPRPSNAYLNVTNFSFPSGHATLISIFAILIFHCLRNDLKTRRARGGLLAGSIFLMLLVGSSRIYLNVHWLSDIIGGYALGIFSVTFCILAVRAGYFIWPRLRKLIEVLISPMYDNKNRS